MPILRTPVRFSKVWHCCHFGPDISFLGGALSWHNVLQCLVFTNEISCRLLLPHSWTTSPRSLQAHTTWGTKSPHEHLLRPKLWGKGTHMLNVQIRKQCFRSYQQNDSQKHLCLLTSLKIYTRLQDMYSCGHTDKEEKCQPVRKPCPWPIAVIGGWS